MCVYNQSIVMYGHNSQLKSKRRGKDGENIKMYNSLMNCNYIFKCPKHDFTSQTITPNCCGQWLKSSIFNTILVQIYTTKLNQLEQNIQKFLGMLYSSLRQVGLTFLKY